MANLTSGDEARIVKISTEIITFLMISGYGPNKHTKAGLRLASRIAELPPTNDLGKHIKDAKDALEEILIDMKWDEL